MSLKKTPWLFFLVPVLLCAGSGCKVELFNRTFEVSSGDVQYFTVDAPIREQKATIEVRASSPVNVYVVLEKHIQKAVAQVTLDRHPGDLITLKEDVQDVTFEATIPANEAYGVIIYNRAGKNKTNVSLRIVGK